MTGLILILAVAVQAQDTSAYLDPDARVLVERARAARSSLETSIRGYTGVVKQRVGVVLRTPLKDRTLFRSESAARIRWSRDDEVVIKMLGARQFHPGSEHRGDFDGDPDFGIDELFDPSMDRLYFGMTDGDDDDVWIEHPLLNGAESRYRFQTGDTITMTFADARQVRVIELRVLPRRNEPKLITGSIWIEPVSGAIVKAAYRLASAINMERDTDAFEDDDDLKNVPGLLKPFEIDVNMISVEYSFWRMQHWLPRSLRMEGAARAGILKAPAVLEIAYDIEDVIGEGDTTTHASSRSLMRTWRDEGDNMVSPKRRNGHRVYVISPVDKDSLRTSPFLPPPVWQSSPDFITEKELREMYTGLADLPVPKLSVANVNLRWGPQQIDLLRYNRVEALSVGVRAEAQRTVANYSATSRLGVGDLSPNVELIARRPTLRRTTTLTVAHGLTAVDERSLGIGSSMSALILGRDDGDYYRTTGVSLAFAPPITGTEWYRFTLFAEQHRSVDRETNFNLPNIFGGGFDFRPNLRADRADLGGATLVLRKYWGSDPNGWQAGLDWVNEGAAGDFQYARTALTARTAFPIIERWRAALEVGGGTSEGDLPAQKQFFLGGSHTLRGYEGSSAVGSSFARARAELAYTTTAVGLAAFSDAGWAGLRNRFDTDSALVSAGVGATILDGLIRIDLARALRRPKGWRLELHFDSVL